MSDEIVPLPTRILRVQSAADDLYERGFNVVPRPMDTHTIWPWKPFLSTRLPRARLAECFDTPCNLGVIVGRLSGNLAVIDCQTKETYVDVGTQFTRRAIPRWSVRSGAHAGGHYYVRIQEGEVQNASLEDIDIWGTERYVLAPPSVDLETGGLYWWNEREGDTPPIVSLADLGWLPLELVSGRIADRYVGPDDQALHSRTIQIIEQGAITDKDLFKAACDMCGCGFPLTDALAKLKPAAERGGLDRACSHRTICNAYEKERNPTRKKPRWLRAREWALGMFWSGRTGNTDRRVFMALCDRAREDGRKGTFCATYRQIQDLARIGSRSTVRRALARLVTQGYVIYMGEKHGSLWAFGEEPLRGGNRTITLTQGESNGSLPTSHDAMERGALGVAYGTLDALLTLGHPMMPKALAGHCKITQGQASSRIRTLKEWGLVERVDEGWVPVEGARDQLDAIAWKAGTEGKGERRVQKHKADRADYAAHQLLAAQGRARPQPDVRPSAIKMLKVALKRAS